MFFLLEVLRSHSSDTPNGKNQPFLFSNDEVLHITTILYIEDSNYSMLNYCTSINVCTNFESCTLLLHHFFALVSADYEMSTSLLHFLVLLSQYFVCWIIYCFFFSINIANVSCDWWVSLNYLMVFEGLRSERSMCCFTYVKNDK